jgi:histidyl-tRNA synthetase
MPAPCSATSARHLAAFAVPFRENPRIVRGLDYYSHTAFEFVTDRLGAQGTVMGGGRYDGLVEEMGGPVTPAVGWAAGVERLAMLMEKAGLTPAAPRLVTIIPVSEAEEGVALRLLQSLRVAGVAAEMGYRGNLKRRMERANKSGAALAIILGENELSRGLIRIRDLDKARQFDVKLPAERGFDAVAGALRGLPESQDPDRLALALQAAYLETDLLPATLGHSDGSSAK